MSVSQLSSDAISVRNFLFLVTSYMNTFHMIFALARVMSDQRAYGMEANVGCIADGIEVNIKSPSCPQPDKNRGSLHPQEHLEEGMLHIFSIAQSESSSSSVSPTNELISFQCFVQFLASAAFHTRRSEEGHL